MTIRKSNIYNARFSKSDQTLLVNLWYFIHTISSLGRKGFNYTMDKKRKKQIDENLQSIAEREGLTVEEIRLEIGRAVSMALKSTDPKVQNFWHNFPCEGDTPTIDEVISHLAEKVAEES